MPQKEDVLRSLGLKTAQQKKRDRAAAKKQAQRGQRGAPEPSDDDEESEQASGSESEGEEEEERAQQGGQQPPAGGQQRSGGGGRQLPPDELEPVQFVPSKAFTGARPGYAFKKGRQGLGYYLDAVQQRKEEQQRQQGAQAQHKQQPGKGKGKKQGQQDAAKAAQKAEWQALKQRYTHAPIGGAAGADGDRPAASSKARAAAAAAKPAAKPAAAQPMLPGRLKELKRQRLQQAAAGQLEGFSSDDEAAPLPASPPASKRHKALPGRLRKKLAKQKAARD